MAQKAGKVWREHGALEFRECVGDDLNVKMGACRFRAVSRSSVAKLSSSHGLFTNRVTIAIA